jgi:hypothetical protein
VKREIFPYVHSRLATLGISVLEGRRAQRSLSLQITYCHLVVVIIIIIIFTELHSDFCINFPSSQVPYKRPTKAEDFT